MTGPGEAPQHEKTTIPAVMERMVAYFGRDTRRINHALKVYAFACIIGARELPDQGMQESVSCTALLHDIGVPEAERKYGSSAGMYQQVEGPPIAREILAEVGMDPSVIDRVCFIIGHHHTYSAIDGVDFQVLVEADFLVNIFEEDSGTEATESIDARLFRTETGRRLLRTMYLD